MNILRATIGIADITDSLEGKVYMNISCGVSRIINKIERHYRKENLLNSKYLIIKRECGTSPLGLFAYYITTLAWIEYALRHNMIPVVDMKNYENTFHKNGEIGKVNTWELFFEQPCGVNLETALKSGKARYVWNDIPEYQPNDSLDFLMNREIVSFYHMLSQKYIRFVPQVQNLLDKKCEEIFGGNKKERILGVLARGTDYTALKPYFHPVQPNLDQLAVAIDRYVKEYACEKIYVATEDSSLLEQLKEIYGERLLFTDQKRVEKVTTYLNYNSGFVDRDPFLRGVEYLSSIYLLSKCNGIVAGRTSGTVGAVIMADSYEFCHVFSLGRYGLEDKILDCMELY